MPTPFLEASRLYYAFDIAPGFWTWLGDPALAGQVASIDAVRNEITGGTGDLVDSTRSPAPESKTKIKIPDVCDAFGVVWTDPFSAYRSLGLRLVV